MRPLATGERFSGNGGRIARIPSGALALVWKDWVGFKRSRGSTFRLAAGCTFWILCGVGAALTAIHFDDPSPLVTLGALTTALLAIATPTGALLGLTNDLGKPLFWLSPATLRARMAAWTFARAWRGGFTVGLAPLAAGLVLGNPGAAGVAFLLAFAANWSLQSLGVGLFALFPDPVDARGPMALLRLFVTVAYVVPAALVGAALYAATTSAAFAAAGAAAALAAEGWAVVELASMRFEEHGAALATLVRAT